MLEIRPILFDLPANIGQLSNLSVLKLLYAHLGALPPSFGQLSSLERLEFFHGYGPHVGSSQVTIEGLAPLKQLTQLKHLRLGGSLVRESFFPAWLGTCHFPVLEDLRLDGELQSLPPSISNFRSLTALTIERSRISEVPESIGSLNLLKRFYLGYATDAARDLPTSFSRLTSLEELDVTTDMQSFALIKHANKLTELRFSQRNYESRLPYPEFLWTFTSLKMLSLSRSSVPSLPDALGNLKNLEFLFLQSHQNLEELPETIGNLTSLTSIQINYCPKLLKLPESIGKLKDLRELRICQCQQLTTLPESIGDLHRLQMLNLDQVWSINSLPLSIGNLHALKVLIVDRARKVFLPKTFADLVLDKPAEECSLEYVSFGYTNLVNGTRVGHALRVLLGRGVLQYVW